MESNTDKLGILRGKRKDVDNMEKIYEYLDNEENSIKEEIEKNLREMCAGVDYRDWSEDMIDKLYVYIIHILEDDLMGQEEDVGRLEVTKNMVITAMMMYVNAN